MIKRTHNSILFQGPCSQPAGEMPILVPFSTYAFAHILPISCGAINIKGTCEQKICQIFYFFGHESLFL
jgi:hypothetical protein